MTTIVRKQVRKRGIFGWFFLLVFLALFPMFSRHRVSSFEAGRWEDADFLSNGAEFGSDDSDGDSGGDDD